MLVTLLLLVLVVVLFARIVPTDVIDVILADSARDDQSREQLEEELGLNKPIVEEYFSYLFGVIRGDFGQSLLSGRDVRDIVSERIWVTVELAVYGLVLGALVGTTIGVISAIKQDGALDYALRSVAVFGLTVPNFALATAAIVIPSIYWQWTPPLFYTPFSEDPVAHLKIFILPAVVLAIGLMGAQMRVMRTQMLEVLRQDYIRTARVKGLAGTTVIMRHALRNALIPVISLFGLQVAVILSGSVILESIFGLPGMGTLLLQSVNSKDWPVVQGVTLIIGIWVVTVNLLVDLSYGLIDPRVKVT
jgi:peptide/nickel transport system permease protein